MGRNAETNKARRAQTHARLMDAAYSVFGEKGFRAARIEDIARLAGVAKGLLYEHFEGKEGLVREFAAILGSEMEKEVRGKLKNVAFADAHTVLQSAFEATFEVIDRHRELASFFVREGRSVSAGMGRVIHSLFDRLERLALVQFQRGMAAGLLRDTLDYRLLARAVTGLMEQAAYYYLTHPELARARTVETLVDFVTSGVRRPTEARA
ncbi:MAG: TetR/AcrR family transcriptional regulator [Nitrospirae bacterium]|nr:TetR/AcrR family transcriptional regulator [Nitrospirota bacterium]